MLHFTIIYSFEIASLIFIIKCLCAIAEHLEKTSKSTVYSVQASEQRN